MNLAKIIKTTIEKRTPNRSKHKEWERFIVYVCAKELGELNNYNFRTTKKEWEKESEVEKFEKMIKKYD